MILRGDARQFNPGMFPKRYQIVVADPPWYYNDRRKIRKDSGRPTRGIGAVLHYPLLKPADLCRMRVAEITADRALLFLWCPCPQLPSGLAVMDAWGFSFATVAFVWCKLNPRAALTIRLDGITSARELQPRLQPALFFGPGYYTGSNVELVLLGRKKGARSIPHRPGHKHGQVVFWPRPTDHSRKPEIFQDLIEDMYPDLDKVELFARRPRPGWDVWGNEPTRFKYEPDRD